jgi:hypothetical protein
LKLAWVSRDAGLNANMGVKKRQKGAQISAKRAEKPEAVKVRR